MNSIAINGTSRSQVGKKSSKEDRRTEKIPCVMYGGDAVIHFTTTAKDVKKLIYTPDFYLADISVDGNSYRCILKDVQWHPVEETIQHLDFLELKDGKAVKVELPVKFEGSSPGVKLGGKLQQTLRRIKVKTTPEKMVDCLVLDVSSLELGQSIRVRDIQVEEGIEIMNPMGTPVASIEIPRALRSATAAAETKEED